MKLDLLTNATVVEDAIRSVEQKSKDNEKPKSSSASNEDDKEESNEPDLNQDEELEDITQSTTNSVF